MSRLPSQEKMGYYPCPPSVVSLMAKLFVQPVTEGSIITDPCAGEGKAIAQLAKELGIPESNIVACELDPVRSEILAERLPEASVTGDTDFQSASYGYQSASLVYLNPPYDSELGHRYRVEYTFLYRAMNMLVPGGLMMLVIPESALMSCKLHIWNCLENVRRLDFPGEDRKFRELVIAGVRRQSLKTDSVAAWSFLQKSSPWEAGVYSLPPGKPFVYRKQQYTDMELLELMDYQKSLDSLLGNTRKHGGRLRPPLQLGDGHRALLLAAGYLNGRIAKPGKPPHVVRGTCRKRDVVKQDSTEGGTRTQVVEEKIELLIRTVDATGVINDLCDTSSDAEAVQLEGERDSD